jgi:hypothetical protein
MTIKEIQKKVLPLLQSYDIHRAGLFGSSAREQMSAESDVDILIDLKNDVGLVEFVGLKQKLEEELGSPVDLWSMECSSQRCEKKSFKVK